MSFTYTQLTQAVQDFLQDDEATFVSQIPTFIKMAEERILKSVRLNVFQKNVTGFTTSGNRWLAAPADFLYPIALSIEVSGAKTFLMFKELDFLQAYAPDDTATGQPRFYAQFDVDYFQLAPTPDADYATDLQYGYRPASLVDAGSSGTTWLSTNAAQCLLYGTLFEAAVFIKAEADMMAAYNSRFMEALARLKDFGEGLETTDEYRYGKLMRPKT